MAAHFYCSTAPTKFLASKSAARALGAVIAEALEGGQLTYTMVDQGNPIIAPPH
jgi:hypothetical protein